MHRWESHKKAADIARNDNTNLFALETYYTSTFEVRTSDVSFLRPTLLTLMSGRLMLSWSYVREFYSENKRISQVEKNMWSHGLSELEVRKCSPLIRGADCASSRYEHVVVAV